MTYSRLPTRLTLLLPPLKICICASLWQGGLRSRAQRGANAQLDLSISAALFRCTIIKDWQIVATCYMPTDLEGPNATQRAANVLAANKQHTPILQQGRPIAERVAWFRQQGEL